MVRNSRPEGKEYGNLVGKNKDGIYNGHCFFLLLFFPQSLSFTYVFEYRNSLYVYIKCSEIVQIMVEMY